MIEPSSTILIGVGVELFGTIAACVNIVTICYAWYRPEHNMLNKFFLPNILLCSS